MGHNTLIKQRNIRPKLLLQDNHVLTVRDLHFSSEQTQDNVIHPEGLRPSCVKGLLCKATADGSLENTEENGSRQQSESVMEAKGSNHLLSDEDEEDSGSEDEGNTETVVWNSTEDDNDNDDDFDDGDTADDDTVLSVVIAKGGKQILLDEGADADDEDADYDEGDDDSNGDDEDNNDYDESTIDDKSETSVPGGGGHEHSENNDSDADKEGSTNLELLTTDADNEVEDESISFMTKESTNAGALSSIENYYHGDDIESIFVDENENSHQGFWTEEFQQYLNQSLEFRAGLQYQVRIILIQAHFVLGGRTESIFLDIYSKIFRKSILCTGFRSATELCKAMPHIVNRKLLDEKGEFHLVESAKNLRVVAGIRSGLRRAVFNILKSHPDGIPLHDFEEEFSREIGKALSDVLKEHAYSIPTVECMIRDMLDIAGFKCTETSQFIVLCKDADDPALTDGLLIGKIKNTHSKFNDNHSVVDNSNTCDTSGIAGTNVECADYEVSKKRIEGNKLPSYTACNGLPPDISAGEVLNVSKVTHEARDIERCKYSETAADFKCSISSPEEYILRVKLCLRLLLACWNFGNGVKASNLLDIYEKTYASELKLNELGFTSIGELVNCWSDITLLPNEKPGIVYLRPSVENKRIVKTVRTGLRATVFSALLSSFPDGMDVSNFVQSLHQSLSGNVWGIMKMNGYMTDDISDIDIFVPDERHNFQLSSSEALRSLVSDMSDFVRLGCQEDGSLVVKLRGEGFPILDFPDCDLDCSLHETIWPDNLCPQEIKTNVTDWQSQIHRVHEQGGSSRSHFDVNALESNSHAHDSVPSPSHSCTKLSLKVLKHQIRLILGSHSYLNCGLHCQQLPSIYEKRVGQPLVLVEHGDVKSLLCLMPDVVSLNSLSGQVSLTRSKHNCRILSVVKSGIRQVLYWSLLKNPGGIWAQLLEGWYNDFVGKSLVTTLSEHGYKISRNSYLSSVSMLLEDMCDFVWPHPTKDGLYVLAEDSEDPTSVDARLLDMSPSDIQYDPLREHFQSFYSDVGGSGRCSSDILDLLTRKSAMQLNEIEDSDSQTGTLKHELEHPCSKAHAILGERQKFEIMADAAKANVCGHDGMKNEGHTCPKEDISKSIFESESEDETGLHPENFERECEKKSNLISDQDQSTASDEDFRVFCRARIAKRDNLQSLGQNAVYP